MTEQSADRRVSQAISLCRAFLEQERRSPGFQDVLIVGLSVLDGYPACRYAPQFTQQCGADLVSVVGLEQLLFLGEQSVDRTLGFARPDVAARLTVGAWA